MKELKKQSNYTNLFAKIDKEQAKEFTELSKKLGWSKAAAMKQAAEHFIPKMRQMIAKLERP